MAARAKARRRVLDLLFEAEARGVPANQVFTEYSERRAAGGRQPFNPYVAEALAGVTEHLAEVDERVTTAAVGWTLDRMPAVDRNVLRIAVWEIWWRSDIPDRVAVAEAVVAVKELSTDESPAFVNGVLGRIMADHGTASADDSQSRSGAVDPGEHGTEPAGSDVAPTEPGSDPVESGVVATELGGDSTEPGVEHVRELP